MKQRIASELRLGALLSVLACLSGSAIFASIVLILVRDMFGNGPQSWGMALTASALGGWLAVFPLAILIDRRGPHPVMAVGVLVVGIGLAAVTAVSSLWQLIAIASFVGIGMAVVAPSILYALAAKGSYSLRGSMIGLIAALLTISPGRRVADALRDTSDWQLMALGAGVVFIAVATVAFVLLPRLFPAGPPAERHKEWRHIPEEEVGVTGKQLVSLLGFWRTVVLLGLVSAFAQATFASMQFFLVPFLLDNSDMSLASASRLHLIHRVSLGLGALGWGITSDFVKARKLLVASAFISAPIVVAWMVLGAPGHTLWAVLFGLALGAAIGLPWVILADHVGVRFIAIIGALMLVLANMVSSVGPMSAGFLQTQFGGRGIGIEVALFILIIGVAAFAIPRPLYSADLAASTEWTE